MTEVEESWLEKSALAAQLGALERAAQATLATRREASTVVLSGYLKKRGRGRHKKLFAPAQWQTRWFEVLGSGEVRYFKKGVLKGRVATRGCEIVRDGRRLAVVGEVTMLAPSENTAELWFATLGRFGVGREVRRSVAATTVVARRQSEESVRVEEIELGPIVVRARRASAERVSLVEEEEEDRAPPAWMAALESSERWPVCEAFLEPLWAPVRVVEWDEKRARVAVVGYDDVELEVCGPELRSLAVPVDPSPAPEGPELSLEPGSPVRAVYLVDRVWYEAYVVEAKDDYAVVMFAAYDDIQHTLLDYLAPSVHSDEDDVDYFLGLLRAGVPERAVRREAEKAGVDFDDVIERRRGHSAMEEEHDDPKPLCPALLADLQNSQIFGDVFLANLFRRFDRRDCGKISPLDFVLAVKDSDAKLAAAALSTFATLDDAAQGTLDLDAFKRGIRNYGSEETGHDDVKALLSYWRTSAESTWFSYS